MKNGWKRVGLEEVTQSDSPITYGVVKPGNSGDVLFIRGGDIAEGRVLHNQLRTITSKVSEQYKRTLLRGGELLISLVGQPGQVAVVPSALAGANIARQVGLIRLGSHVDANFICYFLRSPDGRAGLGTFTGGSVQQVINLGDLRKVHVPIPPRAEQRRIVGILDEAFDGIATAKANAEKNLQNARALFESELNGVFANAWKTCELVTLTDLASDITDGDHLPPPKSPTGVPFITIGNIAKDSRTIDFSETFTVPRTYFAALKEAKRPKKGDVLYTVTGSFGIPVIVTDDTEFCFQRHIGLVRPKPETVSKWLYYLLLSPQVFRQANERATGAAQRTVSLKVLRGFTVPKVAVTEQYSVVKRLQSLSAEAQRLASIYQRKLAALEELKKSLLHQAFSGQL